MTNPTLRKDLEDTMSEKPSKFDLCHCGEPATNVETRTCSAHAHDKTALDTSVCFDAYECKATRLGKRISTLTTALEEAEALAYRGAIHLPGHSYKRLLEEMSEELDATKDAAAKLESELEEARKERDELVAVGQPRQLVCLDPDNPDECRRDECDVSVTCPFAQDRWNKAAGIYPTDVVSKRSDPFAVLNERLRTALSPPTDPATTTKEP
jgi:hypothetical protein